MTQSTGVGRGRPKGSKNKQNKVSDSSQSRLSFFSNSIRAPNSAVTEEDTEKEISVDISLSSVTDEPHQRNSNAADQLTVLEVCKPYIIICFVEPY